MSSGCRPPEVNPYVPPDDFLGTPVEGYQFGRPTSNPAPPSPRHLATPSPDTLWSGQFTDPLLARWIALAFENNPDLAATAARLDAAAARIRQSQSSALPSATLGANGSRGRSNLETPAGVNTSTTNRFEILGSVAWEVDLWGRLRDQTAATVAAFESDQAALEYARMSLGSNVAATYYGVVAAESRLRLRLETASSVRRTLEVVEGRFERGLTTALDVRSARADLASAESSVAAARNEAQQQRRTLEVLAGEIPSNQAPTVQKLPILADPPSTGLPSDLLIHRPDIRAAAFAVEQAIRGLSAAEKARLPSIELSANAGRAADDLSDLSDPDFTVWGIAARAVAPIYQGGRIRAGIAEAEALRAAAAASYRGVVLTAFSEVETALAADRLLAAQLESLDQASEEARAAEALALEQYGRGLVDITTVLSTQRRTFDIDSARIDTHLARIRNRLNLLLAIGDPALPDTVFLHPPGITTALARP